VNTVQLSYCIRCLAICAVTSCMSASGAEGKENDFQVLPGPVRLTLPATVYAVPGIEINVYFDNVVLVTDPDDYVFDVTCDKGFQYDDRWCYLPAPGDVGEHRLTIEVRDQNNAVLARARTTIRVASPEAGKKAPVSFLAIGDSHLQRDFYLQHVLDLSVSDKNLGLTLVGSRGAGNKPPTTDLRHEGYNGWTAQAFVTRKGPKPRTGYYVPAETASPFLYEQQNGESRLDFRQYCRDLNHGAAPDFVFIQVGGNDIWRATDSDIDKTIDGVFGYFDALIAMVHGLDPNTRVGLAVVDSPSRSQHGFRNYQGPRKQTRWQYRRNQHRMVERMVKQYSGRESDKTYLIPVNVNVDCVHGFPMREYPINGSTAAKEQRVYDGSHLSPEGYRQYGDEIYAWIKSCLTEP
jgi:lysophospholipase L1-like esterase